MRSIKEIEDNYISMSDNDFSDEIKQRLHLIDKLYPFILKNEIDYIFVIHRKKMMNEPLYLPDFQI